MTTGSDIAISVLQEPLLRRRLAAYALRRFGIGASEFEDVIGDTILSLVTIGTEVRFGNALVFRVLHDKCCDRVRHIQTARTAVPETRHDCKVPENAIELREILLKRPARERRLLWAYYVEGRSLGEIASRLRITPSGAWHVIHRCLVRVRRLVAPIEEVVGIRGRVDVTRSTRRRR